MEFHASGYLWPDKLKPMLDGLARERGLVTSKAQIGGSAALAKSNDLAVCLVMTCFLGVTPWLLEQRKGRAALWLQINLL